MHTLATQALADGWIDTGRTLGTNLTNLLLDVVVPLIALIGICAVWAKTRSAPAAIVAIVLGAIVIWGARNMDTLSTKTGQDVNSTGSASVSSVVGPGLSSTGASGDAIGSALR